MRVLDTPYYNLFSKSGRHDIYFAFKRGVDLHLIKEIISHTWFGIRFRLKKLV